jgi:hypothetical protein
MDYGGTLWLIIDVLFVAVLAGAILYGTHEWRKRRRDRLSKAEEEKAVDRVYREDSQEHRSG